MNLDARVTRLWLDSMLLCGLVLSYDPTMVGIEKATRIEIAPAGLQHFLWAQKDLVYLEAMAEVTPLLDREAHGNIGLLVKENLPHARRNAIREFLNYLLREDSKYCFVPDHTMYEGQRRLAQELSQTAASLGSPVWVAESSRFGRPFGKVVSWNTEKGYGFIAPAGGGANLFVHFCVIVNQEGDTLPVGGHVEYDYVAGDKGPKAVRVALIS
jgi:CspA family cold shock protein